MQFIGVVPIHLAVSFVADEQHRSAPTAKRLGDLLVQGGQPVTHVHHEAADVGFGNGSLFLRRLLDHRRRILFSS